MHTEFSSSALQVFLSETKHKLLVIGWASDCGSRRDEPRENKNPYSSRQYPNSGSAADKKTE